MENENKSETRSWANIWTFAAVIFAILVVWSFAPRIATFFGLDDFKGNILSDVFAPLNALFSGLAFACLIFATVMQREELKLQRKELQLARKEAENTRAEIRGQKEQAILQNKTLEQQNFENTFFNYSDFIVI